jgi:hypothetical protein
MLSQLNIEYKFYTAIVQKIREEVQIISPDILAREKELLQTFVGRHSLGDSFLLDGIRLLNTHSRFLGKNPRNRICAALSLTKKNYPEVKLTTSLICHEFNTNQSNISKITRNFLYHSSPGNKFRSTATQSLKIMDHGSCVDYSFNFDTKIFPVRGKSPVIIPSDFTGWKCRIPIIFPSKKQTIIESHQKTNILKEISDYFQCKPTQFSNYLQVWAG